MTVNKIIAISNALRELRDSYEEQRYYSLDVATELRRIEDMVSEVVYKDFEYKQPNVYEILKKEYPDMHLYIQSILDGKRVINVFEETEK